MKKIINIALILALVLNLFTICASAADYSVDFEMWPDFDGDTIEAGTEFYLGIEASAGANLMMGTFEVAYDANMFEIGLDEVTKNLACELGTSNINEPGKVTFSFVSVENCVASGEIFNINFVAKETANGPATFTLTVDPTGKEGLAYSPSGKPKRNKDKTEVSTGFTKTATFDMNVKGSAPAEFTVTPAYANGTFTITVANAPEAGNVYAALFKGGVLVDCGQATLADAVEGVITINDVTGDYDTATVFVWDDAMVPLLATPANVQ